MLTKETLEGIREFGLVETDVPGIKHVMLGTRGNIKKWAQMEVGIGSKLLNPAMLSGIGGMMTQLMVTRKVIPLAKQSKFREFASNTIQTQRDELPERAFKFIIVKGTRYVIFGTKRG